MNSWINYHHLFYFKTIAEEGGVSKAAQKLRIGQPTLSAQLKQFEDSLGLKLFERKHKKLILTEQGKVALDYARNIFKMGSEMYEVLQDRLNPQKPALCLGSLDGTPKQITLELVKKAQEHTPCQITLLEGKLDALIRELLAHRIDVIVSNYLPSGMDMRGLNTRKVTQKTLAFYGTKKFKHLKRDFPQSLAMADLILPTYDSKLRFDLDHWAKLHSLPLNVMIESQDIAVKNMMALEGMGLVAAADHTLSPYINSGEVIEIGKIDGIFEELYLISAQRRIENPISKFLMKSFKI